MSFVHNFVRIAVLTKTFFTGSLVVAMTKKLRYRVHSLNFKPKKTLLITFLALIGFILYVYYVIVRHKPQSSEATSEKTQQHDMRCQNLYKKPRISRGATKIPTTYSRKADHFHQSRLKVDTTSDEKKCPELYEIARTMLNGEKIKLPYETNNTRWKFRERTDLDILSKTKLKWNHPWQQGDSAETKRKRLRYNISASTIKARKYVITYGHNCCKMTKERAVNQAIDIAKADYAEAFDLTYLSVPFQISHSNLLRHRKGAGYWLWKPYIILKTLLTKMNDGDLLIYHDAGAAFIKDAGPLYKLCLETKYNVLTFHQPYEERYYSKRDAFVLMGMNEPRVYAKGQFQRMAGLQVYLKTCTTIQFLMEYLAYASDRRISSDDKNVMGQPNFENFRGHRHDQSVFSLLSKKWGILELRDPCTCGRNKFKEFYKYASGPYHSLYINDRVRD